MDSSSRERPKHYRTDHVAPLWFTTFLFIALKVLYLVFFKAYHTSCVLSLYNCMGARFRNEDSVNISSVEVKQTELHVEQINTF